MPIWFTEQDRRIYTDASGQAWDPLALRLRLVAESAGAVWKLLEMRDKHTRVLQKPPDATAQGVSEFYLGQALTDLVRISRAAFRLAGFPDKTDAEAIEHLDQFVLWLDSKKAQARTDADLLATYRVMPSTMTYDDYVGLELNRDRIDVKEIWRIFVAITWAQSTRPLPRAIFDLVADNPAHADDLAYKTNSGRR